MNIFPSWFFCFCKHNPCDSRGDTCSSVVSDVKECMSSPHLGTFEWSRGGTSLLFRQQCSAYSPPAQEMAGSQFRINTWLNGGRIWPQGQSSLFVFNGNTRQLEFKISESHTRSIILSAKVKNIWTAADLQAVSFSRNLRCK